MKTLDDLSGPWRGLSTQGGLRISEAIRLTIGGGRIFGTGSDIDGDFDLSGSYGAEGRVHLVRVYTRTNEFDQEGVGTPYDYLGTWDGAMIAGGWFQRDLPYNAGPFEMWPEREEDVRELMIAFGQESRELVTPGTAFGH